MTTMKQEPLPPSDREESSFEAVSALFDGECDRVTLDNILADRSSSDAVANWAACALIGDVLRASGDGPLRPSTDFLAGVRAQIGALAPAERVVVPEHVPLAHAPDAANDPVFRWKMVAGLASLAAVAAVGWTTWLSSGMTVPQTSPQLVQAAPAAPSVSAEAVLVATPQGPVVRDARLEQLLAEHRQHGGMTALQASTGFLRNATFDAGDAR